jgi:membrane protein DedA with SNARE-associated domain
VSVLAGISGMRAAVFVPLATLSLVVRALLVLGFAAWIREYIEVALAWIDEYWIPGTVVMVALVAVYRWRRRAPSPVMED